MSTPMIIPVPDVSSIQRIHQLERALVLSLDTMQLLVERLQAKLGPGFLGEDLEQFTGAITTAKLHEEVSEIDRFLSDGHQPKAIRHFHDVFGHTWDEAHAAIQQWNHKSPAEKLRSVRLARYIKSLEAERGQ